jgi:CRP-like cAMP-binding protein
MADIYSKIKNLEIFDGLPEIELRRMASQFELVHLKNREVLFEENTPIQHVYFCLYGSVKIQKQTERDKEVILNFLGRGEFLGVSMAGLPEPVFPVSVVALESSAFLKFSLKFYNDVMVNLPRIRQEMGRQTSERFLELQTDRCLLCLQAPQKVADLFLRLLQRQVKDCRRQIVIPLTRHDIALRIGTEPETVTRILSRWTRAGILKTVDRHIEIIDLFKLEELRKIPPVSKKLMSQGA